MKTEPAEPDAEPDNKPDIDFKTFWSEYPRKAGDKKKCEEKFNKLPEHDKFNAIQGAKHQKANNPQWKDPGFIPLPTTFINQKRWLDEIAERKPAVTRVAETEHKNLADMVWSAMTQMYGKPWIDRYGEKPNEIWQKMMATLSVDRVKRGLRNTLDANNDFPPSLPKFMGYCARTFSEQQPPAKPAPKRNKPLALNTFRQVGDILGVNLGVNKDD